MRTCPRPRARTPLRLIAGAVALSLLLPACGSKHSKATEPEPTPAAPWGEPNSTPTNVLKNLVEAYIDRDLVHADSVFEADAFTFEFAPAAREDDPTVPATWGYEDERLAMEHLFADRALSIVVMRSALHAPVAATGADSLPLSPAGLWKVRADSVHIDIRTVSQVGEPLEYVVASDRAEFYFREHPEAPARDSLPSWRLVYCGTSTSTAPSPRSTPPGAGSSTSTGDPVLGRGGSASNAFLPPCAGSCLLAPRRDRSTQSREEAVGGRHAAS
jgi:hypothetical protein